MLRPIARRYRYEGRVQGVGFRRIAESLASLYKVTGYVMNLSDGRVELHVEGRIDEIDDFVLEIDKKFETKITRVTQELVDLRKYHKFSVAFERECREVM